MNPVTRTENNKKQWLDKGFTTTVRVTLTETEANQNRDPSGQVPNAQCIDWTQLSIIEFKLKINIGIHELSLFSHIIHNCNKIIAHKNKLR